MMGSSLTGTDGNESEKKSSPDREQQFAADLKREALFDEFEAAWRSGDRPDLQTFLDRVPELDRNELLRELLGIELDERVRRGEVPQFADYGNRFPQQRVMVEDVYREAMRRGNASRPPTVARFIPIDRLGAGGQGEVWLMLDPQLNRRVALKILQPARQGTESSLSWFRRESEISGKLEHPNIVPVYDVSEGLDESGKPNPGSPCYVMRVFGDPRLHVAIEAFHARPRSIDDRDLLTALRAFDTDQAPERRLDLERCLANFPFNTEDLYDQTLKSAVESILRETSEAGTLMKAIRQLHASDWSESTVRKLLSRFQRVCEGVAYAHSRGVIHRDLKPDNVMLGEYGETLIADWGLAKIVGRDAAHHTTGVEGTLQISSDPGDLSQTKLGELKGTPAYMSPEQAMGRNDELGPATDIYSLGAILYCILTGQPPFTKKNWTEIRDGEFPHPSRINPKVPKSLEAITLKAMARRPSDRYAKALDLAADIERWLNDDAVAAWREPLPARASRWIRRNSRKVIAATTAVIAVLALLFVNADYQRRIIDSELNHQSELTRIETEGRKQADELRDQAVKQANLAIEQLVRRAEDSGANALQSSKTSDALAWFVEGVRQSKRLPQDTIGIGNAELRLRHLMSRVPTLRGVITESGPITGAELNDDGTLLLTVQEDGKIRIWDVKNMRLLDGSIPTITRPQLVATISESGDYVAVGYREPELGHGLVELWNVRSHKRIGDPQTVNGPSLFLKIDEEERRLICVTRASEAYFKFGLSESSRLKPDGGTVATFHLDSMALAGPHQQLAAAVGSVSADRHARKIVLTLFGDLPVKDSVQVWNTQTLERVDLPFFENEFNSTAALDPTGSILAVGDFSGTVRLWDLATGKETRSPINGMGREPRLQFCSPETLVVGRGNTVLLDTDQVAPGALYYFNVNGGTASDAVVPLPTASDTRAISPQALVSGAPSPKCCVAVGTRTGAVHVFDLLRGKELCASVDHTSPIVFTGFSPVNKSLLTVSTDGVIRSWSTEELYAVRASFPSATTWNAIRPPKYRNRNPPPVPSRYLLPVAGEAPESNILAFNAAVDTVFDVVKTGDSDKLWNLRPWKMRSRDISTRKEHWTVALPGGFDVKQMEITYVGDYTVLVSNRAPVRVPSDLDVLSQTSDFGDHLWWQTETATDTTLVSVIDSRTGKQAGEILEIPGPVLHASELGDGRILLAGNTRSGHKGFLRLLDPRKQHGSAITFEFPFTVLDARIDTSTDDLTVLYRTGQIQTFSIREREVHAAGERVGYGVVQFAVLQGEGTVSGDLKGELRFNRRTGPGIPVQAHKDTVLGISVSPDGTFVASIGSDGTLCLTSIEQNKVVGSVAIGNIPFQIQYSPDGRYLVLSTEYGSTRFFDAMTLLPITSDIASDSVRFGETCPTAIRFSADKKQLLLRHYAGWTLWDIAVPETDLTSQVIMAFGVEVNASTGTVRSVPGAEYQEFLRRQHPEDEWLAWLQFRLVADEMDFSKAIAFVPQMESLLARTHDTEVKSKLADVLYRQKEFKRASVLRRELWEANPNNWLEFIRLGRELIQFSPQEGIEHLDRGVDRFKDLRTFFVVEFLVNFWKSFAYAQLGRFDEAAAGFAKARSMRYFTEVISGNQDGLCNNLMVMSRACFATGDIDSFRELCVESASKAISSSRPEATRWASHAICLAPDALASVEQLQSLANVMELATKDQPENVDNWIAHGELLVRLGRSQEALVTLSQARERLASGGEAAQKLSRATVSYFTALAHARLNQHGNAKSELLRARAEVETESGGSENNGSYPWSERLLHSTLDAEVTSMFASDDAK